MRDALAVMRDLWHEKSVRLAYGGLHDRATKSSKELRLTRDVRVSANLIHGWVANWYYRSVIKCSCEYLARSNGHQRQYPNRPSGMG